MDASPLQDVVVKVPAERLAEFYEWYGRWMAGPPEAAPAPPEPGGVRPWDPATDLELATEAWHELPPRARALLGTLVDHPDERYTGADLAELHDIPNGRYGVAGVWAWPGRRLRARGRPLPFTAEPGPEGGSTYRMSPRMAALFTAARRAADGST